MKLKLRENADINTVTGISDIIIDSINKKWDNIRDFNSIIVNLNEEGYEELVPVIESILEDENRNVGKLQQLVELISPTASSIDDGRQEAIDELDNVEVKVEEEMKLDENFTNVSDKVTTQMDDTFFKANKDHDRDEKEAEDALKENEKLAKETVPKEGETGKKVTSKALKAMHLSESLFDEDSDELLGNNKKKVQMTESANVKFDIAREQIKKFKEGKMPKNWTPKDYINDLVSRKHITKEEGDKLLSEDFDDSYEGIESFRSYAKQAMFKIKEAYTYITNDEQYSEAMHSLIDAQSIIDRLMDEMGNQYLDGEY